MGFWGACKAIHFTGDLLSGQPADKRLRCIAELGKTQSRFAVYPLLQVASGTAEYPGEGLDAPAFSALAELGDVAVPRLRGVVRRFMRSRRKDSRVYRSVDPFRDLAFTATDILGHIGGPKAVDTLIAALRDDDLCCRAIMALGRTKSDSAVEPLRALMDDHDNRTMWRPEIAEALGSIGDPSAIPSLVPGLSLGPATPKYGNRRMREACGASLLALGWQPTTESERARFYVALRRFEEAASLGEVAIEPLLETLDNLDENERESVPKAIASIGACAIPGLIKKLEDGDACRYFTGRALVELGATAVPDLIKCLHHQSLNVRRQAIDTLGEIGDQSAVGPLSRLLRSEELFWESRDAGEALGKIGGPEAAGHLLRAWTNESEQDRRYLIEPIGRTRDPRAVDLLLSLLDDTDDSYGSVAEHAVRALGHAADARAVPRLVDALDRPWLWGIAIRTLGQIGHRSAASALIAKLNQLNEQTRSGERVGSVLETLAWALGRIADPNAITPLVAAMHAGHYTENLPACAVALEKILAENPSSCSVEDCGSILQFPDRLYHPGTEGSDYGSGHSPGVDYSLGELKELARTELARKTSG